MKKLIIALSACALMSVSGLVMAQATVNPAPAENIHFVADDQQPAAANQAASSNSDANKNAGQAQQSNDDDQSSSSSSSSSDNDSDADYE